MRQSRIGGQNYPPGPQPRDHQRTRPPPRSSYHARATRLDHANYASLLSPCNGIICDTFKQEEVMKRIKRQETKLQPRLLILVLLAASAIADGYAVQAQLPGPCEQCRDGIYGFFEMNYCIDAKEGVVGSNNCWNGLEWNGNQPESVCHLDPPFCSVLTVTPPAGGGDGYDGGGGGSSSCVTSGYYPATCFSCSPTPLF